MPKLKKQKSRPSIISQCPECQDIVTSDGSDQYRVKVIRSVVVLGPSVPKELCRECVRRFQIG